MKYLIPGLLFFLSSSLQAQDGKLQQDTSKDETDFFISSPQTKIKNSLYSTIRVIDSRTDTTNLGIINIANIDRTIKPKHSLNNQFAWLLNTLNDSSAGNGDLLIQVNRFIFSSLRHDFDNRACYCLRLRLYVHTSMGYQQLSMLDTAVIINDGAVFKGNFRKRAFTSCSKTLTDFLSNNLSLSISSPDFYNLDDVLNIDTIEKNRMPLYNADIKIYTN